MSDAAPPPWVPMERQTLRRSDRPASALARIKTMQGWTVGMGVAYYNGEEWVIPACKPMEPAVAAVFFARWLP